MMAMKCFLLSTSEQLRCLSVSLLILERHGLMNDDIKKTFLTLQGDLGVERQFAMK